MVNYKDLLNIIEEFIEETQLRYYLGGVFASMSVDYKNRVMGLFMTFIAQFRETNVLGVICNITPMSLTM